MPGRPGKLYNQYPDAKFLTGVDGVEDTSYRAPAWGFFVRHASHVAFEGCKATVSTSDPRAWLATKDASDVKGGCTP